MSTIKTIQFLNQNFPDPVGQNNFIHNEAEVDIGEFNTTFKVVNGTLQNTQDYDSDAGFTYDPALLEFSGSELRQVLQITSESRWGANYNSTLNGNWGDSALSPIATSGSPVITGGKLDLTTINSNVTYDMVNSINPSIGAIKFKYTPQQTGVPTNTQQMFFMEGVTVGRNRLFLQLNSGTGQLSLEGTSSIGGGYSDNLGVVGFTAFQEYEIEINWDYLTGEQRVFIDGVQFGATINRVVAKDNNLTSVASIRLGGAVNSNMLLDDLIIFDAVQHTSDYTAGYTVPNDYYVAAVATYSFVGAGLSDPISVDNITNAGVNLPTVVGDRDWET